MLEGNGFKNTMKKIFAGSQTAWNIILKPALNVASPYIRIAVSAKTKNLKVGQATANFLKSVSGGKVLSLTDMHGSGLRLKVILISFQIMIFLQMSNSKETLKKC